MFLNKNSYNFGVSRATTTSYFVSFNNMIMLRRVLCIFMEQTEHGDGTFSFLFEHFSMRYPPSHPGGLLDILQASRSFHIITYSNAEGRWFMSAVPDRCAGENLRHAKPWGR